MPNYNKRWIEHGETGNFLHSRRGNDTPLGEMLRSSFKGKFILVIWPNSFCLYVYHLKMNLRSHKTCIFIETLFTIAHNWKQTHRLSSGERWGKPGLLFSRILPGNKRNPGILNDTNKCQIDYSKWKEPYLRDDIYITFIRHSGESKL